MITLHYLNDSRAFRVLWLLEELGLDYDIKIYQRNSKTLLAPDELKRIHPLGKSPVITDDKEVVAESAVIIEYLAETYGGKEGKLNLIPSHQPAHNQYRYWLHYAEGSFMPFLVMRLVFETLKSAPMPFFVRPIIKRAANEVVKAYIGPNIKTHLAFIEHHLSQNTYFAGDEFSGADIQMSYPLQSVLEQAKNPEQFPHISSYINRLSRRAPYQHAMTKANNM